MSIKATLKYFQDNMRNLKPNLTIFQIVCLFFFYLYDFKEDLGYTLLVLCLKCVAGIIFSYTMYIFALLLIDRVKSGIPRYLDELLPNKIKLKLKEHKENYDAELDKLKKFVQEKLASVLPDMKSTAKEISSSEIDSDLLVDGYQEMDELGADNVPPHPIECKIFSEKDFTFLKRCWMWSVGSAICICIYFIFDVYFIIRFTSDLYRFFMILILILIHVKMKKIKII